jgi:ammonia channel protein AmtB
MWKQYVLAVIAVAAAPSLKLLLVPLLRQEVPNYMGVVGQGVTGLFYGDSKQFFAQVIEVCVCVGWNVIVGGIAFKVLDMLVGNRVPPEIEIAGLDIPEMGAPGYPEFIQHMSPEQVPASQVAEAKAALAM